MELLKSILKFSILPPLQFERSLIQNPKISIYSPSLADVFDYDFIQKDWN